MCGRYDLSATPQQIRDHFVDLVPTWGDVPIATGYNIAPSSRRTVVRYGKSERTNVVDTLLWGFRPAWLKRGWINARAESLFTTAAFKQSAKNRRCLVMASGWYEWQVNDRGKQPYYLHFDRVFAFAGVWTARQLGDSWEKSFAIVTTAASPMLEQIHDRMPLVLHPRHYAAWLSPETEQPADLMQPFDNGKLEAYPVSTFVNDPKNDSAVCVTPMA